ncbi:MAG: hypothetical protein ACOCVI_00805 [Planctomycetota bacterium]
MVRKRDIKMIDEVVHRLGLSRQQRRLLHRQITGRKLTYREIVEEARDVLRDFPKK